MRPGWQVVIKSGEYPWGVVKIFMVVIASWHTHVVNESLLHDGGRR